MIDEAEILYGGQSWDWPALTVGDIVRVFRTSASSPLWFYDPEGGEGDFSLAVSEIGMVREVRHECYRVTVLRNDRELYVDWSSRYWVRLITEPDPPLND